MITCRFNSVCRRSVLDSASDSEDSAYTSFFVIVISLQLLRKYIYIFVSLHKENQADANEHFPFHCLSSYVKKNLDLAAAP